MSQFQYPSFLSNKSQKCLRFHKIEIIDKHCAELFCEDKNSNTNGIKFKISTSSIENILNDQQVKFFTGDWIGVYLNEDQEVLKIDLLAPNLFARNLNSNKNRNSFSLQDSIGVIDTQIIAQWNYFLSLVRQFFNKDKFIEVSTPTLVKCPGTEPFLNPFKTKFEFNHKKTDLYLPTSPELNLKKLIAAGWGPLFEIRSCFRNSEVSDKHQPEFWMLEWYRPGYSLQQIQEDCQNLVNFLISKGIANTAEQPRFDRATMADLFKKYLDFSLTPKTSAKDLLDLAESKKIWISESDKLNPDFDDLFYLIFVDQIENKISPNGICFLWNYPPSQAALARLTDDGWGDRFEMYFNGFEIANAYHELNDPVLQRQRANEDNEKKIRKGFEPVSLDEDFFAALESGMPPTSGIAMGLERLFLALTGRKSLNEIRLFPMK